MAITLVAPRGVSVTTAKSDQVSNAKRAITSRRSIALVVEPEIGVRKTLVECLRTLNLITIPAPDIETAIVACEAVPVEVMLIHGVDEPELKAVASCRRFRPVLHVGLIRGSNTLSDDDTLRGLGIDAVVQWPLDLREMDRLTSALLRGSVYHRETEVSGRP
jgi:DNA-binding response OmpR family regulator